MAVGCHSTKKIRSFLSTSLYKNEKKFNILARSETRNWRLETGNSFLFDVGGTGAIIIVSVTDPGNAIRGFFTT